MDLVPTQGPGVVELVAIKLADGLIRAGRYIHSAWAVVPPEAALQVGERLIRWRSHVQAFVAHGDPLRFSQRRMCRAGIVSRPAWDLYKRVLVDAGVLLVYPRSGCWWAYGWDRRKFGALVRRGVVALPYPDCDPPPVFTPRAVAQPAHHTQPAHMTVAVTWARDDH